MLYVLGPNPEGVAALTKVFMFVCITDEEWDKSITSSPLASVVNIFMG